MATLRTPEEKAEIVEHCIELERKGGDIIAYLRSQNYISPMATWCNIQRQYLNRKPYEYTDGRPGKGKAMNNGVKIDREQILPEVIEAINQGINPIIVFEEKGCKDPKQTYISLKAWARIKHPEAAEKMPDLRTIAAMKRKREQKTEQAEEQLKLGEGKNYKVTVEAADKVPEIRTISAKTITEAVETPEWNKQPKIFGPAMYDGMTIREVEGNFGRYRYSAVGSAIYIDYENREGFDTLSLTVEHWRAFRSEQEKAAKILGVEL